jgi:hypothetical protein
MPVSALVFFSAAPSFILGQFGATVGLGGIRRGSARSSNDIHGFLVLWSEFGLGIRYSCHCDRFCHFVLVLDHLEVQGSFVHGLEVVLSVFHQFFPDLVFEAGNEELCLVVLDHGFLGGDPVKLVVVHGSNSLGHVVRFGSHELF